MLSGTPMTLFQPKMCYVPVSFFRSGALLSKVPIINGPGKLLMFIFKIKVSIDLQMM